MAAKVIKSPVVESHVVPAIWHIFLAKPITYCKRNETFLFERRLYEKMIYQESHSINIHVLEHIEIKTESSKNSVRSRQCRMKCIAH